VRVEQVGRAVQRDGGLAGARAALNHQDSGRRRPDDRVLLRLQRGDDVGHPAGSRSLHRGKQGRLPGQAGGAGELSAIKHLVIQASHPPAAHDDVAAAPDAVRRVGGGHVEGPRRRGAPVEQERLARTGLVPQADAPDVQALAGPQVEPAEAHAVLRRVQPGQLPGVPRDRGVPVEP